MKNGFSFFRNVECEYFPCHKVDNKENFNCLFCYCPLYLLEKCGGNFSFTDKGVKIAPIVLCLTKQKIINI